MYFVYKLVTSIEARIVFFGSFVFCVLCFQIRFLLLC